jgi:hypothetical protein
MKNPKSEIRNPKDLEREARYFLESFIRPSVFGFRISNFGFPP